MALTKFTGATNTIQGLADKPNQDNGLTAAQLKAKFDQSAIDTEAYLNNILTEELDGILYTPGGTTAEVIEARKGKASLGLKIDDIDSKIYDIVTYHVQATDTVAELQSILDNTINKKKILFKDLNSFNIDTTLNVSSNTILEFENTTLLCSNNDINVLNLTGNNIKITGAVIDLNLKGITGISTTNNLDNIDIENTIIKNLKITALDVNGGIIINSCTNIKIKNCNFDNINNNSLSRSIGFQNPNGDCEKIVIENCTITNGNIAINLYHVKDVFCVNNTIKDILDNGYYILSSDNVNITDGSIDNFDEGVVITSSTNIRINNVLILNGSNKGITLRTTVSKCFITNNILYGCNTGIGYTDAIELNTIIIDGNSILNSNINAILLNCLTNSIISNNILKDFLNLTSCDAISLLNSINNIISNNSISNIEVGILTRGIRFNTGSTNNKAYNNNIENTTVDISETDTATSNMWTNSGDIFNQDLSIQKSINPILRLKSTKTAVTTNEIIGGIEWETSDSSSPGVKHKIITKALTTFGNTHNTEFSINGITYLLALNEGKATIVLPTSATGLPSGSIWNNAGTIAIVP